MPTKLILIRHGRTRWNLEKRYCGSSNTPLDECGRRQAEQLRKRLKEEAIHKVYSSDAKRAMQTARLVFKGFKIEKRQELRELGFGCFEGLTYQQILQKYRQIYRKWLKKPFSTQLPDGEHLTVFQKRVVKIFREIIRSNQGKTVAVISHGGVISVFLNRMLKKKDFWKLIPPPGSLTIIEKRWGKLPLF